MSCACGACDTFCAYDDICGAYDDICGACDTFCAYDDICGSCGACGAYDDICCASDTCGTYDGICCDCDTLGVCGACNIRGIFAFFDTLLLFCSIEGVYDVNNSIIFLINTIIFASSFNVSMFIEFINFSNLSGTKFLYLIINLYIFSIIVIIIFFK